eukprot:scaffold273210_cov27-Tisochrysis_lutea.AAC.2
MSSTCRRGWSRRAGPPRNRKRQKAQAGSPTCPGGEHSVLDATWHSDAGAAAHARARASEHTKEEAAHLRVGFGARCARFEKRLPAEGAGQGQAG